MPKSLVYLGHVKRLNEYCIENAVTTITEQVAEDFLEDLKTKRAGRTVNHIRRTLSELFHKMLKKKEVKRNPFANTERAPTKRAFSEHWSDEDVAAIMQRVREIKPQLELPILVILHCATRNGKEMPNLKVKDVDFKRKTLWMDEAFSKNHERESVTIPASLMRILKEKNIQACNPEYYLFTKSGVPGPSKFGKAYLNNHFKEILRDLDIDVKGKGFYRLKNSLAVKLVKANANQFAIQKQFRHKSIKTTECYLASLSVKDFTELDDFSFF